jgi:ribbon-helix-helix CopG family protein
MKRSTVSLPDELADLVSREAARRQISFSEVIRQLIIQGLSETPREIPWAGLFHDPDMAPAERLDEELAKTWADDLSRDRG